MYTWALTQRYRQICDNYCVYEVCIIIVKNCPLAKWCQSDFFHKGNLE